jgi:hypothetical protein
MLRNKLPMLQAAVGLTAHSPTCTAAHRGLANTAGAPPQVLWEAVMKSHYFRIRSSRLACHSKVNRKRESLWLNHRRAALFVAPAMRMNVPVTLIIHLSRFNQGK